MNSKSNFLIKDVFITESLQQRTPKHIDHERARTALVDLASEMARDPEAVLPRYVDIALRETGASSAGLSLNEEPHCFRWRHTRGVLWELEGGSTPRNDSPCGIVLDRNQPLLTRYPERLYDCLAGICIPELLLVPLHIGSEKPFGTLWVLSDREPYFDAGDAQLLQDCAVFVAAALKARQGLARQGANNKDSPLNPNGGLAKWQERRAKELIAARLSDKLSVPEVAEACGLSPSHFTRAFRKSTGLTPYQWLTERRVERAEALLLRDVDLSLSDIAVSCGFADQSHFTRVFKAVVGQSPGALRRSA
ncbi:helix-turn-helix domain-containing protein [Ciceribacter sp. L1K22]|uniref:helix-turn-helix domain-containing protein n=1 Tax=Ciceribacter sp. L1K22 TaxID=2820275 RepID=UPI001ABE19A2|nr:helix-turn-helix domain-containing protein [Ciceribacter sp. L1K22]MBO3760455.1 helix-turn-helix domain-containing protein [Ciceribacter sp. L1K22]